MYDMNMCPKSGCPVKGLKNSKGLPSLGAESGELRAVESDHIFRVRMFVLESLEHIGIVVVGIYGALVAEQCDSFKFFFCSHCVM